MAELDGGAVTALSDLTARVVPLRSCVAWQALEGHCDEVADLHLSQLLDEPGRYRSFSRIAGDFVLDFSRNLMTGHTLELLCRLGAERNLQDWIEQLFAGACVNQTENRPALHMALRRPADQPIFVDGQDVMPLVEHERASFLKFAEAVRTGDHVGATGQRITDVVNIGIGGSDLGLVMLDAALAQYRSPGLTSHFVSNIDGSQLADVLDIVDPERTLFIICSKSFTTLETQLNADAARSWVLEHLPAAAVASHFAAISTNDEAMNRFGIGSNLRFRIWDWVGGRYSLWSSIGLSVAIGIGAEQFRELLAGAHEMDEHFQAAPLSDNLPVLLGLIGVWNQNFLGINSHAVLPYEQRLRYFPAFLQQLDMESCGKRTTLDGYPVDYDTGTVIWGEPGSNAQHSFFQLLHQGTAAVSMDFLAPARASSRFATAHREGLANMLAQAEALARGYGIDAVRADLQARGCPADKVERLAPHKVHPGNRPSNLLLFRALTPRSLGSLVALYEHKVFVQSVIWGINPFDQWGVELGKAMATRFGSALEAGRVEELPGAASALLGLADDAET